MMDEAAAREIERLTTENEQASKHKTEVGFLQLHNSLISARLASCEQALANAFDECEQLRVKLAESERQRKQLSEYIETLARGGIEAAVGAGK